MAPWSRPQDTGLGTRPIPSSSAPNLHFVALPGGGGFSYGALWDERLTQRRGEGQASPAASTLGLIPDCCVASGKLLDSSEPRLPPVF